MSVTIPDDVLRSARISEAELRQELAVMLFERERLTLGQAARLAGLDRLRFQHLLASRGISIHYDVADFEADLDTLRDLGAARGNRDRYEEALSRVPDVEPEPQDRL